MLRAPLSTLLLASSALSGCLNLDSTDSTSSISSESTPAICAEPEPHPHDESLPEWSYHGEDGPEAWGSMQGYELCATGQQQTPIDIVTADASEVELADLPLVFVNYDREIELELLNNGHTLQVVLPGSLGESAPRVELDGEPYALVQFHYHSTSEHTIDGIGGPFEVHFVHQAADGRLLVVGVLFDEGPTDPTIESLLANNPGHELETLCAQSIRPDAIVPIDDGFYHYAGSLTTPACSEGVQWFVSEARLTASAEQAAAWQAVFGGTTNRPLQALHGRELLFLAP